jgi:hypothetical protein
LGAGHDLDGETFEADDLIIYKDYVNEEIEDEWVYVTDDYGEEYDNYINGNNFPYDYAFTDEYWHWHLESQWPEIYSGSVPTSWTELYTGLNTEGLVYLEVSYNPQTCKSLGFRRKGDNKGGSETGAGSLLHAASFDNNHTKGYVCVPTDAYGKIEWKSNGTGNAEISIMGWWAAGFVDETIASGDTAPTTYTTLDVGVDDALCVLKCETDDAEPWGYKGNFKQYAEEKDNQYYNEDVAVVNFMPTATTYALVFTDAEGRVKWKADSDDDYTIRLVCYITPDDTSAYVMYDDTLGVNWTDIDTNKSKGFAYCRWYNTETSANPWCYLARYNGETEVPTYQAGCTNAAAYNDQVSYSFVPVDENGLFEARLWMLGYGDEVKITRLAFVE